jgi:hypothetical protein
MPICIYCKEESSASVGVPHVFPEALSRNTLVLPRGVECDGCNEYAGKRLDSNLVRHPVIAMTIQFLGAPGKRGKTRSQVGGIQRERVDSQSVRVSFKFRGRLVPGPNETVAIEGRVRPDPEFDFLRFRRALHHIGLGTVAGQKGADAALDPQYDRVRRYVRNPKPPNDSWPYGQVERKLKRVPRVIAGQFIQFEDVDLIGIHIFQLLFLVDLLKTGVLERATRAMGGTFVPPEATEAPDAVVRVGGRKVQ